MEQKSVKKKLPKMRPESGSLAKAARAAVDGEKDPNQSSQKKNQEIQVSSEKDIAMDFVTRVHQKFDRLIKASVLFGSQAKNTATANSDIDIIIIIDDAAISWDLELVAWYREELGKLIKSSTYSRELHINTVKLTTWWQDLMSGDPVVINILRYGEVLIDVGGFFNPLKILLQQGKIKSTVESVYHALQRAPTHLVRTKAAKIGAIEGIYWAMVDSGQAALMTAGKLPPSPEHIMQLLKETFVDSGMLHMDAVSAMRDVYTIHKRVNHGEIHDIPGADIDKFQAAAQRFISDMTRIIDILVEKGKKAEK